MPVSRTSPKSNRWQNRKANNAAGATAGRRPSGPVETGSRHRVPTPCRRDTLSAWDGETEAEQSTERETKRAEMTEVPQKAGRVSAHVCGGPSQRAVRERRACGTLHAAFDVDPGS
jgi:hypothetical protein